MAKTQVKAGWFFARAAGGHSPNLDMLGGKCFRNKIRENLNTCVESGAVWKNQQTLETSGTFGQFGAGPSEPAPPSNVVPAAPILVEFRALWAGFGFGMGQGRINPGLSGDRGDHVRVEPFEEEDCEDNAQGSGVNRWGSRWESSAGTGPT